MHVETPDGNRSSDRGPAGRLHQAGTQSARATQRDPHVLDEHGLVIWCDEGDEGKAPSLQSAGGTEASTQPTRGRVVAKLLPAGKPAAGGAAGGAGDTAFLVLALRDVRDTSLHVTVDGTPALPAAVLDDGAEIVVSGTRFVLRCGELPGVRSFDGTEHALCTLCKRPLFRGDAVIACGHCGSPHHEGPRADRSQPPLWCHRYAPRCSSCGGELSVAPSTAAPSGAQETV